MIAAARAREGFTLTELVIVMALASLVLVGLTSFYFSSQQTWIDSSTQAIAQRDGTLFVGGLQHWVRGSGQMSVIATDSLHNELILYTDGAEIHHYKWNPADSLLYEGIGATFANLYPAVSTHTTRFQVINTGDSLLTLRMLELRPTQGNVVQNSTTIASYARKVFP